MSDHPPGPSGTSLQMQKDLDVVKLRLMQCRSPEKEDVWLHSLWRIAEIVNPGLAPSQAGQLWARIAQAPCYKDLARFQRQWIELFAAVGARHARAMADLASVLLAEKAELNDESREYLWMAGLTGYVAAGDRAGALRLWDRHETQMGKSVPKAVFRLLRCHAANESPALQAGACASEFSLYALR